MLDADLLRSIAAQLSQGTQVVVGDKTLRASRTSTRLKSLRFEMDGREYQAIEQNPRKPSRWGQLARDGHQVVQFRDIQSNKYVAVAVDGNIKEYGQMRQRAQDSHRQEETPDE
jgi:hypothetical protein